MTSPHPLPADVCCQMWVQRPGAVGPFNTKSNILKQRVFACEVMNTHVVLPARSYTNAAPLSAQPQRAEKRLFVSPQLTDPVPTGSQPRPRAHRSYGLIGS